MQKIKAVSLQLYRTKERNRIISKAKKLRHNSFFATYVEVNFLHSPLFVSDFVFLYRFLGNLYNLL